MRCLEERETMFKTKIFSSRELAQRYAKDNNLENWTVSKNPDSKYRRLYTLQWNTRNGTQPAPEGDNLSTTSSSSIKNTI